MMNLVLRSFTESAFKGWMRMRMGVMRMWWMPSVNSSCGCVPLMRVWEFGFAFSLAAADGCAVWFDISPASRFTGHLIVHTLS
jgi:hypothetical protein